MILHDNMMIDFNEDIELEASVLYSFLSGADDLLFSERIHGLSLEFIQERTVLLSTQWIFDWLPEQELKTFWYKPKSRDELVKHFLKNLLPPYYCVVLPRGKNITEYKYILHAYEHADFNNEECTALIVMKESEPGSFEREIKPKLEKLVWPEGQ